MTHSSFRSITNQFQPQFLRDPWRRFRPKITWAMWPRTNLTTTAPYVSVHTTAWLLTPVTLTILWHRWIKESRILILSLIWGKWHDYCTIQTWPGKHVWWLGQVTRVRGWLSRLLWNMLSPIVAPFTVSHQDPNATRIQANFRRVGYRGLCRKKSLFFQRCWWDKRPLLTSWSHRPCSGPGSSRCSSRCHVPRISAFSMSQFQRRTSKHFHSDLESQDGFDLVVLQIHQKSGCEQQWTKSQGCIKLNPLVNFLELFDWDTIIATAALFGCFGSCCIRRGIYTEIESQRVATHPPAHFPWSLHLLAQQSFNH